MSKQITVDIFAIVKRLTELESKKSKHMDMILSQSKPNELIGEEIRNNTVLSLVAELSEIQAQIDELESITVTINKDLMK